MKINLRLAEFYLLLLASLTLGLFVLLFAPREGGVSETENRRLQPFPAMTAEGVFSGEYMEQFESFLSDMDVFNSSFSCTHSRAYVHSLESRARSA